MNLHLVDTNPELIEAWKATFRQFPEVIVTHADLLSVAKHCVVSPANSSGFMDGGIDAAYLAFFGTSIETKVMEAVNRRPEGHLPVGVTLLIHTDHARIPWMIVAPTMMLPEAVESAHAYRAMRAILRLALSKPEIGKRSIVPVWQPVSEWFRHKRLLR